ncbi:MAG: TlpA disulfide reductase family protein [Gammaproteobacteria bacterium]
MSSEAIDNGARFGRYPPPADRFSDRFVVMLPRLIVLSVMLLATTLLPHPVSAGGLEVRTLAGEESSLGEQITRGQWTLVMVWTTYCGVCREQYPTISEFHARHHENDATVLGIALDGYGEADKVADYRVAQAHNFPSVLAESDIFAYGFERATGEAFTGTPTYLFFDGDGKLRAYLSGPVSDAALERAIQP